MISASIITGSGWGWKQTAIACCKFSVVTTKAVPLAPFPLGHLQCSVTQSRMWQIAFVQHLHAMQKSTLDPQYPGSQLILQFVLPLSFSGSSVVPPDWVCQERFSWFGHEHSPQLQESCAGVRPLAALGSLDVSQCFVPLQKEPEQCTHSNCSVHPSTFLPRDLWHPGKHPGVLLERTGMWALLYLLHPALLAEPIPALPLCLPGLALSPPQQHWAAPGRCRWGRVRGWIQGKKWILYLSPRVTSEEDLKHVFCRFMCVLGEPFSEGVPHSLQCSIIRVVLWLYFRKIIFYLLKSMGHFHFHPPQRVTEKLQVDFTHMDQPFPYGSLSSYLQEPQAFWARWGKKWKEQHWQHS